MDEIDEFFRSNTDLPNPYIRRAMENLGHTGDELMKICQVIFDVCPECWDSERPCYCWNDE